MTKKHFEVIAECLRSQRELLEESPPHFGNGIWLTADEEELLLQYHSHLVHILASRLSSFNENFSFDKFVEAATKGKGETR